VSQLRRFCGKVAFIQCSRDPTDPGLIVSLEPAGERVMREDQAKPSPRNSSKKAKRPATRAGNASELTEKELDEVSGGVNPKPPEPPSPC
jgi:bacteriocin-like protein